MKEQRKTSRSAEESRRIVERSQRTDKAQAEFCKAEGVVLSTLQLWRKRLSNVAASARTKPTVACAEVGAILASFADPAIHTNWLPGAWR